jgi:hypothetical protein
MSISELLNEDEQEQESGNLDTNQVSLDKSNWLSLNHLKLYIIIILASLVSFQIPLDLFPRNLISCGESIPRTLLLLATFITLQLFSKYLFDVAII